MGRRYDTVSLLTDYGLDDEFVGVVKAVLRDLAAHVVVVDLTHGIAPFDVRAGALALARAAPYLPEGVVLAVVDPGVGTGRRAVAVEVADGAGVFVGPDNGLLGLAVAVVGGAERAVELTATRFHLAAPGSTFAGRDVFAPVAAHLCNGTDLGELGPSVDPASLLPGMVPLPREEPDGLHAEVLWTDRFGNLQLNVARDDLAPDADVLAVTVGGDTHVARRADAYADVPAGALGLVVDSHGMFTLTYHQRSAAAELRVATGAAVILAPVSGGDEEPRRSTPVQLRTSGH